MTAANTPLESSDAEGVAFDEFRVGLARGRFHVIVNPALARPFVAHRLHSTAIALAIIGPGIALALVGHTAAGALVVALGIVVRRVVKWQAPKILLGLAARQPSIYHDACAHGVMEVQRRQ